MDLVFDFTGPGFNSTLPERIRSKFRKFVGVTDFGGNLVPKMEFFDLRVEPLELRRPNRENFENMSGLSMSVSFAVEAMEVNL